MTTTTLNFTQADGNLSGWTAFPGTTTLHVTSNALDAPVTSTQYGSTLASGLVFTTYGSLQLDVTQTNGVAAIGFFDTATNNGYICEWSTTTGIRLRRLDTGVATTVATGSSPSTGTRTIKFEKAGATLRAYVDGTLDCTAVDATYATNATMAITLLESGGASGADNFIYSNDIPAGQIVYVKEVGAVTNTSAGSTSAITVATGGVPVGDTIVILGSCDNTGASGAATTIAAADNHAGTTNAYTLQTPQAIAVVGGATNSGAQGFMLVCPVTTALSAGDVITITYGNSTTAKAINAQQFTGANTTTPVLSGSYAHQDNQTSTTNSVAGTPTVAGQVVCALIAVEGGTADTFTQDADTTDGLWVTLTRRGSGTTTAGQTLNSVYKPVTGTSAQTYNPTLGTARDHCAALLILDVPASSVSANANAVAATVTVTASNPVGQTAVNAAAVNASVTVTATNPVAHGSSTASAVAATVAVTATNPTTTLSGSASAVAALVTVTASNPDASGSTTANAVAALVTVTATNPVPITAKTANAVAATVTATASNPVTHGNATANAVAATVTVTATDPAASGATSGFFEPFTQSDGNLANGWVNDSGVGGSDPIVYVISNKGSTHSNTGFHVAIKTHGITVSGDWQLDFDCDTSLVVGAGGVQVSLRDSTNFRGYGVFVGNAVHVQVYDAVGGSSNITNDGRPGEGSGHLANHVTMTHTAAGAFKVYLDGVLWSSASDTSQDAGAADYIVISIYSSASPTTEATIDNLGLVGAITLGSAGANAVAASVTVTANNPTNTVSSAASAVNAAVTVTATNPVASVPASANAVAATVPVTATNPVATVSSSAGAVAAAVPVTATNPTNTLSSAASAVNASVTVTATNPVASISGDGTANAVNALVTATANNPAVSGTGNAAAVTALVAASATNPTITALSNAAAVAATVTVTGNNPTTKLSAGAPAAAALVTVTATNAVGQSQGDGTAHPVAALVTVTASNPAAHSDSTANPVTAAITAGATNPTFTASAMAAVVAALIVVTASNAQSVRLGLVGVVVSATVSTAVGSESVTFVTPGESITTATGTEVIA